MGAMSPGATPEFDREADVYRRVIRARRVDEQTVVCDLVDDFHHFRTSLGHRDGLVTSVDVESVRWPWATCPDAAANLQPLVGTPLSRRLTDAARHADPRRNCTHQFDCTAHAIVHAARGTDLRRFDIEVPKRDEQGRARARCWVDGVLALEWWFDVATHVDAEPPFDAAPTRGFMAWADQTLEPDAAETAIALRRGATIGFARGWPFDDFARASEVEIGHSGVCYTMTSGRSEQGLRIRGSVRDFAAHPEHLLPD
jgi:hypothetical protein